MHLKGRLIALLAAMTIAVAGCAGSGEAGGAAGLRTPPPTLLDDTPTPGGPAGQIAPPVGAAAAAAGMDATPFPTEAWERHRFFDAWEFAYPAGWTTNRPGEGNVILKGEHEGRSFAINIAQASAPSATLPSDWVNAELTRLNGEGQGSLAVRDAEVAGDPARIVSGLILTDVPGLDYDGLNVNLTCPAARAYIWGKGDQPGGLLQVTAVEMDPADCDTEHLNRLFTTVIGAVRH